MVQGIFVRPTNPEEISVTVWPYDAMKGGPVYVSYPIQRG